LIILKNLSRFASFKTRQGWKSRTKNQPDEISSESRISRSILQIIEFGPGFWIVLEGIKKLWDMR